MKFLVQEKGIATHVLDCQLINPIMRTNGYIEEPETCQRESKRDNFIFCTFNVSEFVTASGITTYDMIAPSNH